MTAPFSKGDTRCPHSSVIEYIKQVMCQTRYEPAEYGGYAICNLCGETLDLDDVPEDAERTQKSVESNYEDRD